MIGMIMGFSGSWGSGLGFLHVVNKEGIEDWIPCDNGAAVRALDSAFDGFIAENHTVDNLAIEGKKIEYSTDYLGILEGFDVVEGD